MRIVPLLFVAVVAAIAIAVKYLPWWGILLGVAALVLAAKFLVKRLFFRLLLKPFELKGAVLKGATAEVHSVTPALEPPLKDLAHSETVDRSRYWIDVTIRPGAANTPFGAWEARELRLVSPESVFDMNPDTPSNEDDTCEIKSVDVQQEGSFQSDEGMKFSGPHRLKLLIAVKPGNSRLKFRYYFEEFGSVDVPAQAVAQAA